MEQLTLIETSPKVTRVVEMYTDPVSLRCRSYIPGASYDTRVTYWTFVAWHPDEPREVYYTYDWPEGDSVTISEHEALRQIAKECITLLHGACVIDDNEAGLALMRLEP